MMSTGECGGSEGEPGGRGWTGAACGGGRVEEEGRSQALLVGDGVQSLVC
jgi:hypothetical protein